MFLAEVMVCLRLIIRLAHFQPGKKKINHQNILIWNLSSELTRVYFLKLTTRNPPSSFPQLFILRCDSCRHIVAHTVKQVDTFQFESDDM